jgi:hypothetical protein
MAIPTRDFRRKEILNMKMWWNLLNEVRTFFEENVDVDDGVLHTNGAL